MNGSFFSCCAFLFLSGRPAFVLLRRTSGICHEVILSGNPCLPQAGATPCPKLSRESFQRAVDNFKIPHVFHAGHYLANYFFPPHNGGILNSAVTLVRFAR
ncbi:MAG: hypothetical protein ABR936_05965 [Bacteroidota bacterium]|jgi:hypothetical protein